MTWIILGIPGAGKTQLMVREAYWTPFWKWNYMYGFEVKIQNYHPLKITEMMEIDTSFPKNFFLDEAYTLIEARGSGSASLNKFMSYVLFQGRKRGIDFFLSAQEGSSLDLRYRHLCDYLVLCNVIPLPPEPPLEFKYTIINRHTRKFSRYIMRADQAKKYWNLYNSWTIVPPFDLTKLKFDLLKSEKPEDYLEEVESVARAIHKTGKKVTHISLPAELLRRGVPRSMRDDVYTLIKELEVNKEKKHRKKRGS